MVLDYTETVASEVHCHHHLFAGSLVNCSVLETSVYIKILQDD